MRHFRRMPVFLWKTKVDLLIKGFFLNVEITTIEAHVVYTERLVFKHLFKCFKHVTRVIQNVLTMTP